MKSMFSSTESNFQISFSAIHCFVDSNRYSKRSLRTCTGVLFFGSDPIFLISNSCSGAKRGGRKCSLNLSIIVNLNVQRYQGEKRPIPPEPPRPFLPCLQCLGSRLRQSQHQQRQQFLPGRNKRHSGLSSHFLLYDFVQGTLSRSQSESGDHPRPETVLTA
jgi:hypothetical protein